jgi:twinkle protein
MSRLRKIATNFNVHIVIVIHPRKTEENEDIQIHSIYGTSKAAQEADNIWMVQSRQNFRIFDVKKNRFDGEIGKVAMGYNKELRSFTQLTKSELLKLHNNEATMEDVLK